MIKTTSPKRWIAARVVFLFCLGVVLMSISVHVSVDLFTFQAMSFENREPVSTSLGTRSIQLRGSPGESALQSALMSLSCFVTPHCFRRYRCKRGMPLRIERKKKAWEEMSFCADDLLPPRDSNSPDRKVAAATPTNSDEHPCLVYSFGIHSATEWETKVSQIFGCEVHAFDPTVNHPNTSHVTFHPIGLQGEGTDMASDHAAEYTAIDPSRLFTLNQIMQKLGHQDREIDVLMMDCEGKLLSSQ